jgi:hypothetical protein
MLDPISYYKKYFLNYNIINRKNLIRPRLHMPPQLKKRISNYQKVLTKKFVCTSSQPMCLHIVTRKYDFIFDWWKKDKPCLIKSIFLAPNLSFFRSPNEKSIFHGKNLRTHGMWRCTSELLIWYFKMFQRCISNYREHNSIYTQRAKISLSINLIKDGTLCIKLSYTHSLKGIPLW